MKPLNWNAGMKSLRLTGIALLLSIPSVVLAAPGDVLFLDNFERSNPGIVGNGWVTTAAAGACDGVLPTIVTPAVLATSTITITGTQLVPVNGITVGGQQIMSAAAAGATAPKDVAKNIRDRINACTTQINGACTVTGYSATRNNGVITITAPGAASGTPVITLGTPTGTGTAQTFTATAFTAYTPAVTTGGNTGCSGIDADTPPWNGTALPLAPRANANSRTMFTRWATVSVDSPVINLAGKPGAQITYWVRRGSDCFSEWPGNNMAGCGAVLAPFTSLLGEEFQTQYKNSAGAWVVLSQYPTDALPGETFRPVLDLPADALWSGFQLRFSQPSGSGFGGNAGAAGVKGYDYWHLDDVKIVELDATNSVGAFCDTFEGDLSRWTFTGNGNAAIGSKYFQNGLHDLDIRWGAVTVTSKPSDMTAATGNIQFWVKRGVGVQTKAPNVTGSEIPEAGENLVVEYLTTTPGVWAPLVPLTTFVGGGTGGQVWCPTIGPNCSPATPATNSIAIPANANKAAFQLRFRMLNGSGYDQDYWHVDDVCLGTVITGTDLRLTMTPTGTTTLSPGATSTVTFTVTNLGPNVEPGNITITDTLPAGLSYVAGSSTGWSTGTYPTGLTDCSTVGQVLTCTRVGTLAVGASATLTITLQADANAVGTVTHSPVVGGQSLETVPGNNTATNSYSFSPSAFEAYETSTVAGAITGRIFTKLVGTSFNLKAVAKNAAGSAINTAYNKAMTVDLIDGTQACVAGTAALTGVTVTTSPYTYLATEQGSHTFTFTSTRAYPNVKVRMKDNAAIGCSSDNFAIRPSAFTITSTATNNDSTGASTIVAGAAFTLNAASVVGYNGTPVIDNTAGMIIGSPNQGALGGSFAAADVATGTATGASFTYSEVGNFGLAANAVYDSTFTAVDQPNDCVATTSLNFSNALDASGKYGCSIGSIGVAQTTGSSGFGRFVPAYFTTEIVQTGTIPAIVPMMCPSLPFTCPSNTLGANGMVYSGQTFTVKITAMNASGVATTNYQGVYAKTLSLSAWDAEGSTTTANPGGGSLANVATSAFALGVSSPTKTYTLPVYAGTPTVGPSDFFIRAVDTEGVTSNVASPVEAGLKVAYGQVKVANAYGSELLPLTLSVTAQYYSANGWVTSLTDSATTLGGIAASYSVGTTGGTTNVTKTPGSGTLSGGKLTVKFSSPGSGKSGAVSISPTAPSYLPINSATATFGVFKGANEFIYLRESY